MVEWSAIVDAPGAATRLTSSTADAAGVVGTAPAALVAQSALRGYRTTLEEYTLARVIASEHGSGPAVEMLCIGDAELNRARAAGRTVLDEVTAGSGRYGSQGTLGADGRRRPSSTRLDPHVRHLRCARLLLEGQARGIALGARRYLSPRAQLALWARGDTTHHHPLLVLERWAYGKPIVRTWRDDDGRLRGDLGSARGRGEEPVFPCGLDPWVQLFFRPATGERDARYQLARDLLRSEGRDAPPCEARGESRKLELVLAAVTAAAAAALAVN